MITLEDCIAMCGLTEEEILAIAEHEHIPEIAAAVLAQYLLCQSTGRRKSVLSCGTTFAPLSLAATGNTRATFSWHFATVHPEAR